LEEVERLHYEVCAETPKPPVSSVDLMAHDSTMMRRDNSEWDFSNHPEDEFVLSLLLEEDDDADLKAYLRDHSIFERVNERGMAFDHAPDPHAVVETLRHSQVAIKVAHEAMQLGKDVVHAAVGALITVWVQKRNEKKRNTIEAKQAEPLLFVQDGNRLDIRLQSKKRNKR
jgi:hypothetical protein